MADELKVKADGDIPDVPVQTPPAIPPAVPAAVLDQEKDPLFIELQREKKRTKRLRALLTKNRNLASNGPGTSPGDGTGPLEPGADLAAPVLKTEQKGRGAKADPITAAFNFLGKKRAKKPDGP